MGDAQAGPNPQAPIDSGFLAGLAEILELPVAAVVPALPLDDGNWDSLAIVSCIGLIDDCFGRTVAGSRLRACSSVADLLALVDDGPSQ